MVGEEHDKAMGLKFVQNGRGGNFDLVVAFSVSTKVNPLSIISVLKGHVVSSKLHKRIFEIHAVVKESPRICCSTSHTEGFRAKVITMSSKLKVSSIGDVIFVELVTDNGQKIEMFVTQSALRLQPFLQCGEIMLVRSCVKRAKWKESNHNIGSKSHHLLSRMTYLVDAADQLVFIENGPGSHQDDNVLRGEHLTTILQSRRWNQDTVGKECFARRECCVEAAVRTVHRGWLELHVQGSTASAGMMLYVSQLKFLDHIQDSLRPGAIVRAFNVLPVFLWGTLRGFACTVRSNVQIVRFSTCMTSIPRPVSALAELRSCCAMFVAWRAEVSHRLALVVEQRAEEDSTLRAHILAALESCSSFGQALGDGRSAPNMSAEELRALLAIPRSVPIQEQFRDAGVAQLFAVRAGLDADHIGTNLPQVNRKALLWLCM